MAEFHEGQEIEAANAKFPFLGPGMKLKWRKAKIVGFAYISPGEPEPAKYIVSYHDDTREVVYQDRIRNVGPDVGPQE